MPADKLGHPPPIVQSMILADYVHKDTITGKKFILGTYNSIVADRFPYAKSSLCVFLAITDTHGPTVLRMRVVDVDDQRVPIHESSYPVDLPNPNQVYEITFNTSAIFPSPGEYRIQLLVGNDVLRELRVRVVSAHQQGPSSE